MRVKLSKYVNVLDIEGYYFLHNTVNNSRVKIYSKRLKGVLDKLKTEGVDFNSEDSFLEDLKKQKMIFPYEYNESNLVRYNYSQFETSTLNIILIVTRDCNFRCIYCYENHEEKKVMKEETFDSIKRFIEKEIDINVYKGVMLSFFGGEPLLETKKILKFMNELKQCLPENVSVYGSVTTNGYLLTPKNFDDLINANINFFQITIDGLKNTHDKNRPYKNGGGTWEQIMSNIRYAKSTEKKFVILMRTNFAPQFEAESKEYIKFVKPILDHDKRFQIYFEAVKNLGNSEADVEYSVSESESTKRILELARALDINDIGNQQYLRPFGMVCYAAKNNSILVDYDGKIRKCTVELDSSRNQVGMLNNGNDLELNQVNFSNWTSYELNKKCDDCEILPLCYGRKCPSCYYSSEYCDNLKSLYHEILTTYFV